MAQRLATEDEIRGLGPELESTTLYPSTLISVWSRIAGREIGLDVWGDDASDGHALLVAHCIVRAALGALGPAGPATGLNAAEVSSSFASLAPTEALHTTYWGTAYMALRDLVVARDGGMIVANSRIRQ